jgi:GxxExxY protein
MNADENELLNLLTERVLGAVFEVSTTFGSGFLEKVYQRALLKELGIRGVRAAAQTSFPVMYKGQCVGEYLAELKCVVFQLFAGFKRDPLPSG